MPEEPPPAVAALPGTDDQVYRALAECEPATNHVIADAAEIPHSTTVDSLYRLIDAGVVVRRPDPSSPGRYLYERADY